MTTSHHDRFLDPSGVMHRTAPALGCIIMFLWTAVAASTAFGNSPRPFERPKGGESQIEGYRGASEPATASEVYGQGVRETEWRSPEQERLGFHLPPGFEIELFAAEPMVNKPLNMAWDARGRLWVTSTIEYPYPVAADGTPGDQILILEDTDGDGAADKSTSFADQLNIPMGLLPVEDGVICFSIPYIYHLKDTDGDDRVDERVKLLGPFDTSRDTHGMINALRLGSDGWVYACHGFNNQSRVTAADGSSVSLNSGNTFRFKPDGSRIEQFTQGQVNPFGMTRDEWGNWYSADCHSKPLTGLLPGACYPSFGRPDDGLGFAPSMMDHLHGSTAISGVHYYQAEQFPPEYRQRFYSGNVMTSRINCNAIRWQGATATAKELPDFLTSDDPWFRPVDIQLGMDGALYVADFYNKIIGHYEVPLEHPGRDRTSGRIWRITYRGDRAGHETPERIASDDAIDLNAWQPNLSSPNITLREASLSRLVSLVSSGEAPELSKMMIAWAKSAAVEASPSNSSLPPELAADPRRLQRLSQSCLELLFRTGNLEQAMCLQILIEDASPLVTNLCIKLAAECDFADSSEVLNAIRSHLVSESSQVGKSAILYLGQWGGAEDVRPLLRVVDQTSSSDPILHQASRIAIRNLLRNADYLTRICGDWSGHQLVDAAGSQQVAMDSPLAIHLAGILPAIDRGDAADALLAFVIANQKIAIESGLFDTAITAASKHATESSLNRLLIAIDSLNEGSVVARAQRFDQVCVSYAAQYGALNDELREYCQRLQRQLLQTLATRMQASGPTSEWRDQQGVTWGHELRNAIDGVPSKVMSSLSKGEAYTGVLRSEFFECPSELSFWLAGHNGHPDNADHRKNYVRVIQQATGRELARAFPPRNDTAQKIAWQLDEFAGDRVRIEVVDGDSGNAYAWLAVGRFSVPSLSIEETAGEESVTTLVDAFARELRRADGIALLQASGIESLLSPRQRVRLVSAALGGSGRIAAAALSGHALEIDRCDLVTFGMLRRLEVETNNELEPLSIEFASTLAASSTASEQKRLAETLLLSKPGCELLNILLDQGKLSLQTLKGIGSVLPSGLTAETRQSLERKLASAAELTDSAVDIEARLAGLDWGSADLAIGKQVFTEQCMQCHQLAGQGKVIGPQLDGAIVRGAARMSEDILDPNRNVDKAFRMSSVLLDDDTVQSGLLRENPDGSITLTKQDGTSQTFAAQTILQRKDSTQSLMPGNFAELLSDKQLASLLAFLESSAN